MKHLLLLKRFEYIIPASAFALAFVNKNHAVGEHLPLMKVNIDFENGNLKLEGDWQFMMASNKHNEPGWFTSHRDRVKIETAIYPALPINLTDHKSDGLVFPLEGSIKDGDCFSSCSGLLVIDNVRGYNGLISDKWNISFYLYDLQFDCEIKFKLPLYSLPGDRDNN
jgi:hypothetical protein